MYLETIDSPADLKKLAADQLPALACEIRAFILQNISRTGGHLASNLGAVELTLALHYAFESPKDKFIFDVGHQSYTHKIVTGRKGRFHTVRTYHGLSGFPRRTESAHDIADTGHASTSISLGLGLDTAVRLKKAEGRVIAIIGDGSITGGLALEAINNAGHLPTNLIIIVNNNEMSIGTNIGAFAKYLNKKIQAPGVQSLAMSIDALADKLPFGERAKDIIHRIESSVKAFIAPGIVFRELGFRYLGPVDGHSIDDLIATFDLAKTISGPLLIQVNTIKGKGYEHSEMNPSSYHGVGEFDVATGTAKKKKQKTFSALFGETLTQLAADDSRIVAITAAMCEGTGLEPFSRAYPGRFFDVGIAEGHALTFAAGLAIGNCRPVVALYSTFLQRGFDNVIHDIANMNLPVIIGIDRAGLVPEDGETHQGIFDLAYLRMIPNMTIFAPAGAHDLAEAIACALSRGTPTAIRYPKDAVPDLPPNLVPKEMVYGKAHTVFDGKDGAVLSFGSTLVTAYHAINDLSQKPSLALINLSTVWPLDEDAIVSAAMKYKRLMIIEEGVVNGGIGSAVLEVLARHETAVPVKLLGIPNSFVPSASREVLLKKYRLDRVGLRREMQVFFSRRGFASWRLRNR